MNRISIMFLFFVQLIGAIFYCILSAAYFLPFPSTQVLIGEPIFKSLLSVFGGLFLVFTLVSIVVFKISKKHEFARRRIQ